MKVTADGALSFCQTSSAFFRKGKGADIRLVIVLPGNQFLLVANLCLAIQLIFQSAKTLIGTALHFFNVWPLLEML